MVSVCWQPALKPARGGTHAVTGVLLVVDLADEAEEGHDDERDEDEVDDAVEDDVRVDADDVAALGQAPGDRVDHPEEGERGSRDQVGRAVAPSEARDGAQAGDHELVDGALRARERVVERSV